MSNTIYYDTSFIKVEEHYIPLQQSGESNVRVAATGQLARDWSVPKYLTTEFPYTTPEHINQILNDERAKLIEQNNKWREKYPAWNKYDDANWGYYAMVEIYPLSQTSFSAVQEFYQRAFVNAKPVEETAGVTIFAGYEIQAMCRTKLPPTETLHDTPRLIDAISRWRANWGNKFVIHPTYV